MGIPGFTPSVYCRWSRERCDGCDVLLTATHARVHVHLRPIVVSGDIVPELGKLTTLETLSLRDNHFSGVIPPELGKLTALRHLFMNNNNLGGELDAMLTRRTSC